VCNFKTDASGYLDDPIRTCEPNHLARSPDSIPRATRRFREFAETMDFHSDAEGAICDLGGRPCWNSTILVVRLAGHPAVADDGRIGWDRCRHYGAVRLLSARASIRRDDGSRRMITCRLSSCWLSEWFGSTNYVVVTKPRAVAEMSAAFTQLQGVRRADFVSLKLAHQYRSNGAAIDIIAPRHCPVDCYCRRCRCRNHRGRCLVLAVGGESAEYVCGEDLRSSATPATFQ